MFDILYKMEEINKTLLNSIEKYNNFREWESSLINLLKDSKMKKTVGDLFEYFGYYLIKLHPYYRNNYQEVYLFKNIPQSIMNSLKLPTIDKGFDLLAVKDNNYIGIQCKFRSDKRAIPYNQLATFAGLSFLSKTSKGIFITNCDNICKELENKDNIINIHGVFWNSIDDEYFDLLKTCLKNNNIIKEIKLKPKDYQLQIIEKTANYFQENNNGKLLMACGTGKTITSYFIIERMKYKDIVIVVPSLLLLSQFYMEWSKMRNMRSLLICSDIDKEVKETPGLLLYSNVDEIKEWLKKYENEQRYIFVTYQSGEIIKNVFKETDTYFDICIYDEAHKTAGVDGSKFSLLTNKDFNVRKKLFMTATERQYKGAREDVLSMDDIDVYGSCICELNLREAIELGLLTDYRIITPTCDNEQLKLYLEKNKIVMNEKENYTSESIASAILLLKTIEKYGAKKIITYHQTINECDKFSTLIQKLNETFKIKNLKSYTVDGKKSMTVRNKTIDEFKKDEIAIISSARALTEGINIACVDTVCFVSNKSSLVDIVQSSGRCLRLYPGKLMSNIIIPTFIENYENDEKDNIVSILKNLSNEDSRIVEYFKDKKEKNNNKNLSKIIWDMSIFEEKLPDKINIENWISDIEIKVYESLIRTDKMEWEEAFKLLEKFIENNNRLPSFSSDNRIEKYLSEWISSQRKKYKKNKLDENQIGILNNLKYFFWDIDTKLNENDEKSYLEIKEFIEKNDRLPKKTSKDIEERRLGLAIINLKRKKKYNTLSEDLINKISSLKHFYCNKLTENEKKWLETYKELKNYVKDHKKLPSESDNFVNSKKLVDWIDQQKKCNKENKLNDEFVEKLQKIQNFCYNKEEKLIENDEKYYADIKKYVEENKRLPKESSKNPDEKKLALYINGLKIKKKNNKLNNETIKKYSEISCFSWEIREINENHWMEMHNNFAKIIEESNIPITAHENNKLYNWYKEQNKKIQKNKLDDDKKYMIEILSQKLKNKRYGKSNVIKKIDNENNSYDTWNKNYQDILNHYYKFGYIPNNLQNNNLFNWFMLNKNLFEEKKLDESQERKFRLIISCDIESNDDDVRWMDNYKRLCIYIKNNNKLPMQHSEDKDEKFLSTWISHVRKNYKENKLAKFKIDLLEKIDIWFWNKSLDLWDDKYEELKNFILENGKLPSEKSDDDYQSKIGQWCSNQRQAKKENKISEDRIKKLTQLFCWYWIGEKDVWQTNYDKFKDYVEKNNKFPSEHSKIEDDKKLALWAGRNRQDYKKNELSTDRVSKLLLIKNWYWDGKQVIEDEWKNKYDNYIKFYEKNKKSPDSKSSDEEEKTLGLWYINQNRKKRENRMDEKQLKLFDNILKL